ncbi:TlpA disulfide reductase family protein [Pseudobacter ginsenosidimutans]|uniref:Peroxiredoxin n=1 Tax=Pseudobacter ginsenosidimutans TaxID=661488 RepID=A0A4Q7N3I1_9BACT|nr:TlpA disulfide reductase family protein [Pseudobacter ginsenosidimutans]QEC43745.1 AhpC/TSA family protein [Pseudobacter ginsenosidimutans]RZS75158.1 peroxiredoxin [Pseudobacter ginsenosidimutans]
MKRIFALIVFVFVSKMAVLSQTITGKFEGPVSYDKVYLYQYSFLDHKLVSIDSASVIDGKYKFDFVYGKEPTSSFLRLKNEKDEILWKHQIELYLSKDSILVLTTDSFNNARVLNSVTNYEYALFNEMIEPALKYQYSIGDKIVRSHKTIPKEIAASKEYEQFAMKRRNDSRKELFRRYEDFIKDNPGSWISLYALRRRMLDMDMLVGPGRELFSLLDEHLKQSPTGKKIASRLDNQHKLQIGLAAPAIRLPNTKGQMIDLKDYRKKYVLLEFWSSGCGGCRMESPHLRSAFEKYKSKGFDILSISLDEDRFDGRNRWLKAIEKDGTDLWQQVSDLKGSKSPAIISYDIQVIPQNYLVDPDGIIIARNLRGAALHKKLRELFGF